MNECFTQDWGGKLFKVRAERWRALVVALDMLMNRIFLFALLLACSAAYGAEPSWQFLRFSETLRGEPSWQTSQGTATVRIEENRIRIEAFDVEGFKEPTLIIKGIIDSNGSITATGTRTYTDESPFKLTGKLTTWQQDENGGGQMKRITHRDIIFPLHPHYEFYGFISRTVADK